jgi:N-acyl homoserine lactone hydrolase
MTVFTIEPMVVAYGPHREKSRFTYMHNAGVAVDIPYVSWLIRGPELAALVDVGCSATDYTEHIRPVDRELVHVGQVFADVVDVKPITEHLADRGLRPRDIDIVVLSHLDWDHCMTVEPFAESAIYVQRTEWETTPSHEMFATSFAPAEHYRKISDEMGLELLDGDHTIADGFELLHTPGHTHGGQSAVVRTSEGTFVIAGMCVLKENFYPSEQDREHFKVIPPGGHTDLFQSYDQMLRLKELGGDNVLPLHMTEAFEMGRIGVPEGAGRSAAAPASGSAGA